MSRKLLIKTKNIKIDSSKRKHITREDLVLLEDKVLSSVEKNENCQRVSVQIMKEKTLGD